jgi:hypothetical protein
MFCKHCHDYIPDDSRFCPKCGVRIPIDVAPDPPLLWICTIMLFAVIWSVVARKELQIQFLQLRVQVDRVVNAL